MVIHGALLSQIIEFINSTEFNSSLAPPVPLQFCDYSFLSCLLALRVVGFGKDFKFAIDLTPFARLISLELEDIPHQLIRGLTSDLQPHLQYLRARHCALTSPSQLLHNSWRNSLGANNSQRSESNSPFDRSSPDFNTDWHRLEVLVLKSNALASLDSSLVFYLLLLIKFICLDYYSKQQTIFKIQCY